MAFCQHYSLQKSPVFHALKYIEREGHWTFSEDLEIKTKVQILLDRKDLYGIDLPDPLMPLVLEKLMRRYTGLFSFPVSIEEDYIASACGTSIPVLRQVLYKLALEHVIKYIPADNADVIYLHHDRLRPGNVQLSPKHYQMLLESSRNRKEAMFDYVEETTECRSKFLLRYFGEESDHDCGTCDICRGRKKDEKSLAKKIKAFIDSKGGKYTLMEIREAFGSPSDEGSGFLSILRELIDSGSVPPYHC